MGVKRYKYKKNYMVRKIFKKNIFSESMKPL
jgi:hypothetical protein